METIAREDTPREDEARLGVRRKFYERAFVVFAFVELAISVPAAWLSPAEWGYILAACASAIFGTAAVLFLAYHIRKSALYERAERAPLRER